MADKHSLAQLLSQHAERWNSPAEIKTEIADVPDRTLRRWLGELVHEGVVERSGSRKGTRYRWKQTAKGEQRRLSVAAGSDAGRSPTQVQLAGALDTPTDPFTVGLHQGHPKAARGGA